MHRRTVEIVRTQGSRFKIAIVALFIKHWPIRLRFVVRFDLNSQVLAYEIFDRVGLAQSVACPPLAR